MNDKQLEILREIDETLTSATWRRKAKPMTITEGMRTPWGPADNVFELCDGIHIVSTPGHGGFKVDRKLNARIPQYMRRKDGWYEEDCEYALVLLALADEIKPGAEDLMNARQTVRNYYPDEYERFTGEVIPPGESHEKDRRLFQEEHQDDLVVVSAAGTWHEDCPEGMVLVDATRGGKRELHTSGRTFLVRDEEYAQRSRFGFIVDPDRHQELTPLSESEVRTTLVVVDAIGSRCPPKPTGHRAWDWYDWALRTAVVVKAKRGQALCPPETHRLPAACNRGIGEGWRAGIRAIEVIDRIKLEQEKHGGLEAKLSLPELGRLRAFAAEHGRCWRAALRYKWLCEEDVLRETRNTIGPARLSRVVLSLLLLAIFAGAAGGAIVPVANDYGTISLSGDLTGKVQDTRYDAVTDSQFSVLSDWNGNITSTSVDWAPTTLTYNFSHQRAGAPGSFNRTSQYDFWFMVDVPSTYEISGTYTLTGSGFMVQSAWLEHVDGPFLTPFHLIQQSVNTPNQIMTVGESAGDDFNRSIGSPTGTLLAGEIYNLRLDAIIRAPDAGDLGATAVGNFLFSVSATDSPEPAVLTSLVTLTIMTAAFLALRKTGDRDNARN